MDEGSESTTFLTALQQKYSDEDYRVLFGNLICQERERQEKENAPVTPGVFFQLSSCRILNINCLLATNELILLFTHED